MTCIIGYSENGKVWMGCDSIASDGFTKYQSSLKKVFKVGEFIIGYTSSFRMGQILQYHLKPRLQENEESDEEYMVVCFIEGVRSCMKQFGYATVENNHEKIGTFLVGYHGNVYYIADDFQVNRWSSQIITCGSGEYHAAAAMTALSGLPPRERILRSLEIVESLVATVAGPFSIEEL